MIQRIMCVMFIIALLIGISSLLAYVPTVAFISMGDNGPFTDPAMKFAQKAFNAQVLTRKDLGKVDFKKFAVVWWHDGDSDPGALNDQELKVFTDYADSGGAILLTSWAIRYATPMGLEEAEARQFGPVADDGIAVGIAPLETTIKLPLWKGLKTIDGKEPSAGNRIQVNSTGYPKTGDYFDTIWKNFTTVATAWGPPESDWGEKIAAFGYWKLGKGKVFNMNWRLPNFHANNKDIAALQTLTTNVINWLAAESLYFAVEPTGKLATTWGEIKLSSMLIPQNSL
jgi:hypothetical protein